jgi:hypothetical protein
MNQYQTKSPEPKKHMEVAHKIADELLNGFNPDEQIEMLNGLQAFIRDYHMKRADMSALEAQELREIADKFKG